MRHAPDNNSDPPARKALCGCVWSEDSVHKATIDNPAQRWRHLCQKSPGRDIAAARRLCEPPATAAPLSKTHRDV
jgi:hypothetical protein